MSIVVLGLGKTGTTALLYLLTQCLNIERVIFEPKDYINSLKKQNIDNLKGHNMAAKILYEMYSEKRSLKEFMLEFEDFFDYRIWLSRDPRDQMISAFLYAWYEPHKLPEPRFLKALDLVRRKEAGEKIPFIHLLRESGFRFDWTNLYAPRINAYIKDVVQKKENLFLFPYEDLVNKNYTNLSSYLNSAISGIPEVPSKFKRVARTRSFGSWRLWFESEDINFFKPHFEEYMELINIPDDWELVDEAIPSEHGSDYMHKLRYDKSM